MQDAESHFLGTNVDVTFDAQMARVPSASSFLRRRLISNVHLSARDLTRKRYPHGIFITIRCLLDIAFLCVPACLSVRSSGCLSICLSVWLSLCLSEQWRIQDFRMEGFVTSQRLGSATPPDIN